MQGCGCEGCGCRVMGVKAAGAGLCMCMHMLGVRVVRRYT